MLKEFLYKKANQHANIAESVCRYSAIIGYILEHVFFMQNSFDAGIAGEQRMLHFTAYHVKFNMMYLGPL